MTIVVRILLLSAVIFGIAQFLPGIRLKGFGTAIIVSVVYSVLNYLFFWILALLTLPVMIVTFGLFTFVINAALLWVTDKLIDDFKIKDTATLLIAALLITVGNWIIRSFVGV